MKRIQSFVNSTVNNATFGLKFLKTIHVEQISNRGILVLFTNIVT